jgi:glycine hydroxymethyltransferase
MLYRMVFYGVRREDERIDYEELRRLAEQHRPKLIIAGATAYPREIDFTKFREAADACGAHLCADIAHPAGLIAAGLHPSPVPVADLVTTTTHKTLRGPRSGMILCPARWAQAVDRALFPGIQGGPLMHVIAAKAVCFKEAMAPSFVEYQRRVIANSRALGAALEERGLPLVTGGTDNHLVLAKVKPLGLTGAEAEKVLDSVGITVNKNMIPFDTEKPRVTSGIRLGTAALTTRGMREAEMRLIGEWIVEALKHCENEGVLAEIGRKVRELTAGFPAYAEEWL